MINKYIVCGLLFFVFSCSNIEFVLEDYYQGNNPLKDKTTLLFDKNSDERLVRALYSYFGNSENDEYILKKKDLEKKENRSVKNNQIEKKIKNILTYENEQT